jgi:hypothetical protein
MATVIRFKAVPMSTDDQIQAIDTFLCQHGWQMEPS